MKSKVYEDHSIYHFNTRLIEFKDSSAIRSVSSGEFIDDYGKANVFTIAFNDKSGAKIASYNPKGREISCCTEFQLKQNQELFGVYGNIDKEDGTIQSLGFIVKQPKK